VKFYLNYRTFYQVMRKCRVPNGPVFSDTLRQVTTVVMETVQLVLRQFKNFLT